MAFTEAGPNTSDLGSTSFYSAVTVASQLCTESEESTCLMTVNIAQLSSSGKTTQKRLYVLAVVAWDLPELQR